MNIIWRNDDVSFKTELGQFSEVQKLFKEYIVLHTIAVICKDIQKNPELIKFINENNIDVQIHAWEHYDFTENHDKLKSDLPKCVKAITKYFNHPPSVLYCPWNKSDETVEQIAKDNGLTVSTKKVSLSQFIRFEGGPWPHEEEERVINWHSWSLPELLILEDALKLYVEIR